MHIVILIVFFFFNYIAGSEDVPILCPLIRNVSQYLLIHLLTKMPFTHSHLSISGKKIPVTYGCKHLLWKCLHIHQIRGENEEQKVKLTCLMTLK